MAYKGQNLRIFVGPKGSEKCIAVSTSCTFHVAVQTEDSSTKDDTGNFSKKEVVGKDWDAACDTLYDPNAPSDETAITPAELMSMIIQEPDPTIHLKWDSTEVGSDKNRTGLNEGFEGDAIINDGTVTSPNRQKSTGAFQFLGNGPLTPITV